VPRNYTIPTIKALFAEASACAFPGCTEPLIFHDRGRATVVAEIAHIRSEQPGGPRYDSTYPDDVDGPANLLLLCGKHHRPVDRHEALYTIEELKNWKAAQRVLAGAGTAVTDSQVRSYTRLSADEQKIIMDVARLADQVVTACRTAQAAVDALRQMQESARVKMAWNGGSVYEVDEDGRRYGPINDRIQLSHVEQEQWKAKERAAVEAEHPRIRQALSDLSGEVSVLRMISTPLGKHAALVSDAATRVLLAVGDSATLELAASELDGSTSQLWRVANGE